MTRLRARTRRASAGAALALVVALGCNGGVVVFELPDASLDAPAEGGPDASLDASIDAVPVDAVAADAPAVDAPVPPRSCPPSTVRPALAFTRNVLSTEFLAEGIAVVDLDDDGAVDIITIPYWWSGPGFTARHEVAAPRVAPLDPMTEFSTVYGVYPWDVDEDGCEDIVVVPRESDAEMSWYRNPRRVADARCGDPDARWARSSIVAPGLDGTVEHPVVARLFRGEPVLVMGEGISRTLGWWTPPADDPRSPWEVHPISPAAFPGAQLGMHGLGVGDVNGDGRPDVLGPVAWWEQTRDPAVWRQHLFDPALLGTAFDHTCSTMWTFDVDCDALPDVICARPHDYGLYWWRQETSATPGEPRFVAERVVEATVSQMHAVELADLDGDGVPEIITGKRWFAAIGAGDPGQLEPALLLYYSMRRDASGTHFDPHAIDADSGVGAQFAVADLNDDGRPDIVTATKRGVFYFVQP